MSNELPVFPEPSAFYNRIKKDVEQYFKDTKQVRFREENRVTGKVPCLERAQAGAALPVPSSLSIKPSIVYTFMLCVRETLFLWYSLFRCVGKRLLQPK